jgi:hypothetical protein
MQARFEGGKARSDSGTRHPRRQARFAYELPAMHATDRAVFFFLVQLAAPCPYCSSPPAVSDVMILYTEALDLRFR